MTTEGTAIRSVSDLAQLFKPLADDTRLSIVRLLSVSDLCVGELVERLHTPQNTLSYHLKQLRALGLVRDRRSSADGRDIYYSVDIERLQALYLAAGNALHIHGAGHEDDCELNERDRPLRILYLCTHNSARSQLAEGLTRKLGGERV